MVTLYLAFNQHVKELVVGFVVVCAGHQLVEHGLAPVLCQPQAWQAATRARPLIVKATALSTCHQAEEWLLARRCL